MLFLASVTKRGKTWQYTVSRMVGKKSKPIRKGGFKTKKEATIAAAEVEANLQKGIVPHLRMEPFDEYFKGWLKVYKTDISDITLKRYKDTLKTIIEYFGDKPIQDISKREYQAFLNKYGLTHAKETTRKLNTHIRACVREAIDEGIIRIDFTRDAVITGNVEAKRPEEKHLSYFESKRLMKEVYNRLDDSVGYYAILLGLTSGMRYGEMVGLTRDDFDFKKNEIRVTKTWDYKKGKGFAKTKNDQSIRVIKMDKRTMSAFENLFEKTTENVMKLVFFSPGSKYHVITNENVNKLLRNTLKHLKIDTITIHGLRHTHASVLLYKKVSIYYVSERLGHADIDTTLKHYAHVIKELRIEDTNAAIKTFEQMAIV